MDIKAELIQCHKDGWISADRLEYELAKLNSNEKSTIQNKDPNTFTIMIPSILLLITQIKMSQSMSNFMF